MPAPKSKNPHFQEKVTLVPARKLQTPINGEFGKDQTLAMRMARQSKLAHSLQGMIDKAQAHANTPNADND